jgi:hypothetical protein
MFDAGEIALALLANQPVGCQQADDTRGTRQQRGHHAGDAKMLHQQPYQGRQPAQQQDLAADEDANPLRAPQSRGGQRVLQFRQRARRYHATAQDRLADRRDPLDDRRTDRLGLGGLAADRGLPVDHPHARGHTLLAPNAAQQPHARERHDQREGETAKDQQSRVHDRLLRMIVLIEKMPRHSDKTAVPNSV